MENVGFVLTADDALEELVRKISEQYRLLQETPQQLTLAMYDSFDWRLYRNNLVLYRLGNQLQLISLDNGAKVSKATYHKEPAFIRDLPVGPLHSGLAEILDARRLMKLVEGERISLTLRVLNRDAKTVTRLVYEIFKPVRSDVERPAQRSLWVQPVRGYPRYSREIVKSLDMAGFKRFNHLEAYLVMLDIFGRVPDDYNPRIDTINLEPQMSSEQAARTILLFTTGVMRSNVQGIHEDLDIEFLHDYRVAVRRTRSALTQIPGVFAPSIIDHFKGEFAELGQLTNSLRDLDVYLLKEEQYRQMLPDSLRNGIDPLFDYLRVQRQSALKSVRMGLRSEKYQEFLAEWESFLGTPSIEMDEELVPNAARPVLDLANERIRKRYKRVIRDGEAILADEQVADEKLHILRIDCKKLRYLLEFFSSLYPQGEIEQFVKQLKRLQDNLGDFNDLSVQRDYLMNISQQLPLDAEQSRKTLASIGGLIGVVEAEKTRVMGEFAETFLEFATENNQKRFKALFIEGGAK